MQGFLRARRFSGARSLSFVMSQRAEETNPLSDVPIQRWRKRPGPGGGEEDHFLPTAVHEDIVIGQAGKDWEMAYMETEDFLQGRNNWTILEYGEEEASPEGNGQIKMPPLFSGCRGDQCAGPEP